jgi:hypothetical protein
MREKNVRWALGRRGQATRLGLAALAAGLVPPLMVAGCADGAGEWDDKVSTASAPAPEVQRPAAGFTAALASWPLFVDRLRVFGQEHRVLAQPLAAPAAAPAHWSYERRRSELNALALVRPAGRNPVIASLWTDAGMVGLDALTGDVLWRSEAVEFGKVPLSFPFDPSDLVGSTKFRPVSADGGEILVVQIDRDLVGVDPTNGTRLWRAEKVGCESAHSTDPLKWWPVRGSIVVDATCRQSSLSSEPVSIQVFDARTGTKTQTISPDPGLGESRVRGFGCDQLADCAGIEHYPVGEILGRRSVAWTTRDGNLVRYGKSARSAADQIEVRQNGDFELVGYTSGTDDIRWQVTGEAHDLSRPQFFDVDTSGDTAWVASHSWNGGPPALVRINRANGKITGCQAPPAGAPTRIEAYDNGYLVVGDLPTDRTYAYDPDNPDGAVVLLVPDPAPTCTW